jgi:hypothetical protein
MCLKDILSGGQEGKVEEFAFLSQHLSKQEEGEQLVSCHSNERDSCKGQVTLLASIHLAFKKSAQCTHGCALLILASLPLPSVQTAPSSKAYSNVNVLDHLLCLALVLNLYPFLVKNNTFPYALSCCWSQTRSHCLVLLKNLHF